MENNNVSQEQLNEMMREMQKKMVQLDATVVKTPWMVRAALVFLPSAVVLFCIIGYLDLFFGNGSSKWWYYIAPLILLLINYKMIININNYNRISNDSFDKIAKQLNLFKIISVPGIISLFAFGKYANDYSTMGDLSNILFFSFGISFFELLIQYPILKIEKRNLIALKSKIDGIK